MTSVQSPEVEGHESNDRVSATSQPPKYINDLHDDLAFSGQAAINSAAISDGSFSRHTKWNFRDISTRAAHYAKFLRLQHLWAGTPTPDLLPRSQLPNKHPIHPLNVSGEVMGEMVRLAKETPQNITLAHKFLWSAPVARGDVAGATIGVADIRKARDLVIMQGAQNRAIREYREALEVVRVQCAAEDECERARLSAQQEKRRQRAARAERHRANITKYLQDPKPLSQADKRRRNTVSGGTASKRISGKRQRKNRK